MNKSIKSGKLCQVGERIVDALLFMSASVALCVHLPAYSQPSIFFNNVFDGRSQFDATTLSLGSTARTQVLSGLVSGTSWTAGQISISAPDGLTRFVDSSYLGLAPSLVSRSLTTGQGIEMSLFTSPTIPERGLRYTFPFQLNSFGVELGDWGTCCFPSEMRIRFVNSITGVTRDIVVGTVIDGTNPGVTVLERGGGTFTFVGAIDSSETFNEVILYGLGTGEFLVAGGTLRYALVGFGGSSNVQTRGVTGVLDALNGATTTSGPMQAAIDSISVLGPAQRASVVNRLIPPVGSGSRLLVQFAADAALDAIDARIAGVSGGDLAEHAGQPTLVAGLTTLSGLFSRDAGGDARRVWVKAIGYQFAKGELDGFAGFRGRGGGFAAGGDVDVGNGRILGGSFSVADGKVDFRDQRSGDRSDVRTLQGLMYGATNFDRWYAHAALSYAAHDFDSTRDTGVTGIAKGAFSGYQYGWRVGAGIPMRSGGLRINPQAGLDWSRLHLRSYSESGAGALSLNVASQTVERIRSRVGVRVSWETEVVASKIVPLIQAYWNHEFRKPPAAAAAFVGGGSSFVTPLQPVSRDSIKLGAGAIVSNKKSYEAELRYELDLAHKFVGHNILASARWSF